MYLPQHKKELTTREIEVLSLAADGLTDVAISRRLAISTTTVKDHLATSRHKLQTLNRTHSVARAIRAGVIS